MNPIYSFTDEYERDMAVTNREFEIAMTEAAIMSENNIKQLRVNMALSELKVMRENGTAEDLAELILEAGEEAAQENQGILSKIFSAIAKFFKGIANGISNFFSKGGKTKCDELIKRGEKVTVDSDTSNWIKTLQETIPGLENAANAKDHAGFMKILAGLLVAGTLGGGIFAIWKKTHGKLKNEGQAEKTVQVDAQTAKGWLDWLRPLGTKIGNLFEKAMNGLNGVLKKNVRKTDKNDNNTETPKDPEVPNSSNSADPAKVVTAEQDKKSTTAAHNSQAYQDQSKDIDNSGGLLSMFIGAHNMFEAGEDGGDEIEKINFVKKIINSAIETIEKGVNAAWERIGGVVKGAAAGAVAGATTAIVTGNAGAGNKKNATGNANNAGQVSGFLGEEYIEESVDSDIDPIEAMLSGLAFGGFHG